MRDGLTVTQSRHYGDCWNVVITEWLGIDYDHVRQVAAARGLISEPGFASTERVLEALGYVVVTIPDDGRDGIIRLKGIIANHVVVRCCGQLLNSANGPVDHRPAWARERIEVFKQEGV